MSGAQEQRKVWVVMGESYHKTGDEGEVWLASCHVTLEGAIRRAHDEACGMLSGYADGDEATVEETSETSFDVLCNGYPNYGFWVEEEGLED